MKPFKVLLLIATSVVTCAAHASAPAWVEARSTHFAVMTDDNSKQAVHLADQFERMRSVFHALFPRASVDAPSPILVIAVKDRKGFQALEPEAYLKKGQLNLGGLFLRTPDKNYILLRLDSQQEHPFAVVYHEYTHFMLRGDAEWLPLWLNEGLASFFQNTEIHDKDVDLGKPDSNDILFLREKALLPLPLLFMVDHASPYYHDEEKGSIFYAESWALVHYLQLSDHKNQTHRISNYSELLAQHQDPVTAATAAFGDLKQLQKDLELYIGHVAFSYFRTAAPAVADASTFHVASLTSTQADARRADFLAYNGRTQDAQALLATVMRDDPNNASAFETLGYIALSGHDQPTARKWLTKAVQLDSDSYLTHYQYAIMSMSDDSAESVAQVESSLKKAIQLNPAFAPSYDGLAGFYAMRHQHLEEAHLLNIQATQLDPANLQFRINTAQVLMAAGRFADAARVLKLAEPLAQTPEQKASLAAHSNGVASVLQARSASSASQQVSATTLAATPLPSASASPDTVPQDSSAPGSGAVAGPKHVARGVLHVLHCGANTGALELQVQSPSRLISLSTPNYWHVEFSAENYTPQGEIQPCTDLEGTQATVMYTDSNEPNATQQILAIQIRH